MAPQLLISQLSLDIGLNYDDIRKEAAELWSKLVTADEKKMPKLF